MKKTVYLNQTINVVLQQETEVTTDNCPKGIISKDENGEFRFEEEIRKGRHSHWLLSPKHEES